MEFLTPTEEIATPLRQEEIPAVEQAAEKTTAEIPSLSVVKKPVDLPEPLKKTTDLLEPTQQKTEPTHSIEADPPEETKTRELPEPTKEEEEPPDEVVELKPEPVTSTKAEEEQAEVLEPTSTEETPESTKYKVESIEPTKNEEPEPINTTTESLQPDTKLVSEDLVEKPAEVPPVEPFTVPAEKTAETETVQDPAAELQDSG